MDRLTELSTFLAVVDRGSFVGAARVLGRAPPTITRVVADLEERVGVKLLDRHSRRCAPTEAGRRLAEDARHILADYDEAIGTTGGQAFALKGLLRVTAPYFFGRQHVAPLVMQFADQHPAIDCELDLSDRPAGLVDDGFDLAVRIGPIADVSLKAKRLGSVRQVIVGRPAYLEERGIPLSPSDLGNHLLIQHGSSSSAPWVLRDKAGKPLSVGVRARFTVNQADAAIAAALSGRGLVRALSYQVFDDLRRGTLVTVLERFEPEPMAVQLAWPGGRDRLARVRMLIDHLTPKLQALDVLR